MSKIVLFQTIQFRISMHFSSISPIDRALSGATTPSQNRHGSYGNEVVLCIPKSCSITRTSASVCLVSYTRTLLGGPYSSTEMQLAYSTAPVDRAIKIIYIYIYIYKSDLALNKPQGIICNKNNQYIICKELYVLSFSFKLIQLQSSPSGLHFNYLQLV